MNMSVFSDASNLILKSGIYQDTTVNGDIIIKADNVILKNLTVNGKISVEGDNASIIGCTINADSNAITSSARALIVRENNIKCTGNAITLSAGSYNSLVAENNVVGNISMRNTFNCSVVLNYSDAIVGCDSVNLYIIDNKADSITITGNKYLICDGNTCASVTNDGNDLYNGDNLHNVDARLEVGADEDLLPHTNKDLFQGMERRRTVTAPEYDVAPSLNEYILNETKRGGAVIVPPGAYTVNNTLEMRDISDVTVYAYGVYFEAEDYIQCVSLFGSSNITIKGLTVGYAKVSAKQIHIVEKLGDNKLLMIASAGFPEDIGLPPQKGGSGGGCMFRNSNMIYWNEIGYWGYYVPVEREDGTYLNEDGTFVIELIEREGTGKYYSLIKKGDVIASRINVQSGKSTLRVINSDNVLLKDTVSYGYAGMICLVAAGIGKVKLYRHHNLSHSGYIIDKETYEKYRAIEGKYNVDLELSIDEERRYRGAASRFGSVDATHVGGASEGLDATSALFENSCDDATNQRGYSSMLHKVVDNGDGTYSIIYKDYMAWVYYWMMRNSGNTSNPGFRTQDFKDGDRIFAYASNGHILCDAKVISDTEIVEENHVMREEDFDYKGETKHLKWVCKLRAVKVRAEDVNLAAIEGYNTEISDYTMDNKVIVDNISRNSASFTFDNCMVRNNTGRVLIKTHYGTVKSCTFTNNVFAGVVMSAEPSWGESSVPCHIRVSRCLFDKTSQLSERESNPKFAAIAVQGLGEDEMKITLKQGYIPSRDITIEKNVFRNVPNNFYITASAVDGLIIKDNVFEDRADESGDNIGKAIYLNGCMNIKVSGNRYSSFALGDISKVVIADEYLNLYGSDVDGMLPKNS